MSNITKRSLNFSVTQCYKTSFDLIYECLYYARVFDPGRPRKHLKGRLQLYSQTLDKDGKRLARDEHSSLLELIVKIFLPWAEWLVL
jgi:hypothetical protein